jgi:CO dehydrogenase/acetyl-CoA synthase alpha subunit
MSVGNNIIDASRDLIIRVGHNITCSIEYHPDYLI